MADGFNFLERASASSGADDANNAGNDFLAKFGAVDISGSDGGNGGSPVGNDNGDFDPAIHVGRDKRNADGSFTRKRGRRAGVSGGSSAPARASSRGNASVKAIQNSLEGIHALVAAATGFEDLKLSTDESEPLAGAIAEVAKHYPIPVVDPKVMAIAGLVFVAGRVYAPKFMLVKMQMDDRAKTRKQQAQANKVVPIRPGIEIPSAPEKAPEPMPNFEAGFIDMAPADPASFGQF